MYWMICEIYVQSILVFDLSRRNWNIIVCIIVRLNVGDQQQKQQFSLKWKLDSCDGPRNSVKYRDNNTYWDRCCLNPGIYTLICKNDIGSFGWGNSFIEILGQRYCDDFAGNKAMRRIIIAGMYKNTDIWLLIPSLFAKNTS